jgi:hypothetical protein
MGGKGGIHGLNPDQITKLEEDARKIIQNSTSNRKSVFISFAIEDENEVNLLRGQSKNPENDLEFIDRSVKEPFDSKNAEYIKTKIREKIRQSSITIVYLSNNTAQSKWVNWEINESIAQGKKVIAVHQKDKKPTTNPEAINKHKIKIVPWDHDEIMKNMK